MSDIDIEGRRSDYRARLHAAERKLAKDKARYLASEQERNDLIVEAHGPIKEGFLSYEDIRLVTKISHRRVRQIIERRRAKKAVEAA